MSIEDTSHDGNTRIRLYCSLEGVDDATELLDDLAGFTRTSAAHDWSDWMQMDSTASVTREGMVDWATLCDAVGRLREMLAKKLA